MPKIVDHEQYRKELLSKCFSLFAEVGYSAMTMRQLSLKLGVSTGTLYHYFPNKEALFEQLIRQMTVQDVQKFMGEAQQHTTLTEKMAAVLDFIENHEDYFLKQTLLWVEFYQHQSRQQGYRTQVFQEVWKENEKLIMDAVGIQDKSLLSVLGCFIDGMLLHRMFECNDFDAAGTRRVLLQMVALYDATSG
jgi:AcrR family transcriptional regulator